MTTTATKIRLGKNTEIRVIVDRFEVNPYQTDLFADYRENWVREALEVALKMPSRFYFSELRMMLAHEPPNTNWFGSILVPRMKQAGFRQTGSYRKHTRASRKASLDFEWMRVSA